MQSSMLRAIVEDFGNGGTIDGDLTISGDLTVSGGGSLSFDEILEGTQVIDITSTEAFLVRKDGDGGDVFVVDTTNGSVGIGTAPTNAARLQLFGTSALNNTLQLGNYGVQSGRISSEGSLFITIDATDEDSSQGQSIKFGEGGIDSQDSVMMTILQTGSVGIGTDSPDTLLHLYSTSASKPILKIENEQGGANPVSIQLLRNTSSPADDDFIGQIDFRSMNDAGTPEEINYAYITGQSTDITDGTEDGELQFYTMKAGTSTNTMTMQSGNVGIGTTSPGNPLTIVGTTFQMAIKGYGTGAYGTLDFTSSKGTEASPTDINATDAVLGRVRFLGRESSSDRVGAEIKALTEGTWTGSGYQTYLSFYTAPADSTSVSERMRITSTGSVGIGTAAPRANLEIVDGDNNVEGDNSGQLNIVGGDVTASDTNVSIQTNDAVAIDKGGSLGLGGRFNLTTFANFAKIKGAKETGTSNQYGGYLGLYTREHGGSLTERIRISPAGNVGIGDDAPPRKLSVKASNAAISIEDTGGGYSELYYADGTDSSGWIGYAHGTDVMYFGAGGASRFKVDANSRISLSNNDAAGATGNTVFGKTAGNALASGGNYNTFIGESAGASVDTGDKNTFLGYLAGDATTSASNNVGIGANALGTNILGDANVAIGRLALGTMNVASTASTYNTAIGGDAGYSITTGVNNTIVGGLAGDGMQTADNCVAIGKSSLSGVATQDGTVAIGASALAALISGQRNVAVGYSALTGLTTGDYNTALGWGAADSFGVDEQENVAVGNSAMGTFDEGANSNIDGNVAVGSNAFLGADLGSVTVNVYDNIAIGRNALDATGVNAQTGTIAIGRDALGALTSGAGNLAVGYTAMNDLVEGANNTALGYNAFGGALDATADASTDNIFIGHNAGSGDWVTAASNYNVGIGGSSMDAAMNGAGSNTGVGYASLSALTEGDNNVAVGTVCMNSLTTGGNNTCVGYNADTSAVDSTNQAVIGYDTTGVADNSVTLGNSYVTAVYMAEDSGATVHCAGIQFPATQVANGGANVLDDYEEGEWTIGFTDPSGDIAVNASYNTGAYTRIGRVVHVTGNIRFSSGQASGDIILTGLPYTRGDFTEEAEESCATIYTEALGAAIDGYIGGYIVGTSIYLRENGTTGDGTDLGVHIDSGTSIVIQGTYFV